MMPFISQIERSPVEVFCQSMRIAGATTVDAVEPAKGTALGEDELSALATGTLVLREPATGACKLIGPARGTPMALAALAGERGAVGGESLQERSPTTQPSPMKTFSRVGACIVPAEWKMCQSYAWRQRAQDYNGFDVERSAPSRASNEDAIARVGHKRIMGTSHIAGLATMRRDLFSTTTLFAILGSLSLLSCGENPTAPGTEPKLAVAPNSKGLPVAGPLSRSWPTGAGLSPSGPIAGSLSAYPNAAVPIAGSVTSITSAPSIRMLWQNTATGDRSICPMTGPTWNGRSPSLPPV